MSRFPALSTGALCQFPISKTTIFRTIESELADGSVLKMPADAPGAVRWELEFHGLSGTEAEALQGFFGEMEGQLGTFAFVDPTANLLRHSEDPSSGDWVSDPGLRISSGTAGPFGPSFQVSNQSQAVQRLQQTVRLPGNLSYCFSVYARSEAGSELLIAWSSGPAECRRTAVVGTEWERVFVSGSPGAEQDEITFVIDFPPETGVEIGGLQVECQIAPSSYKRSMSNNGVYEAARFATDWLEMITTGPDQYSTKVEIVASNQEN